MKKYRISEFDTDSFMSQYNNHLQGKGGGSNSYYLTVDIDERGEYGATLYDYNDEQVWDCDTETVRDLIDDGFLRYKPDEDLDRLAKHLGDSGVIPKGSTIDSEKQEEDDMEESRYMRENNKSKRRIMLENRLRAVIRPIVRSILKEDTYNPYAESNKPVKYLSKRDGERLGISEFPNFSATGSISGMKKKYYGKGALLVKCGSFIYHVSSEPDIYFNEANDRPYN